MAGRRNAQGYNDTSDCYRMFGGERYIGWLVYPSEQRIALYRQAGLKCRRLKEELFLRETDTQEASDIDNEMENKP